MFGKQTDLLNKLLTGANSWRSTATAQGVTLTDINAVFPDGRAVNLHYNEQESDWEVTT
jgi:hypothetical protein